MKKFHIHTAGPDNCTVCDKAYKPNLFAIGTKILFVKFITSVESVDFTVSIA